MLSLKKRLIVVLIFTAFFLILLFLSFFIKKTPSQKTKTEPIPTIAPIGLPDKTTGSTSRLKIENAPAAENNQLGEVVFNYERKKIPSSGTIFTQAPTSIPADTISKIQAKLIAGGNERIINTPNGQVIFMQKDTKTLTIYLYSRSISYSDSATPPASDSDTSTLIKKAVDFINSLDLPLDSTTPSVKYFIEKTGDLIQTTNPNEADTIDISFRELVQGLTVFRQYGSSAAAHVWFSKKGVIKKFTYFYSPQYIPQKSVLLPSLSDIEDQVRKNEGTIVGLGNDYQQTPLKNPSKTIFNSVEVGYFNNEKDMTLFPVFVFNGNTIIEGATKPITLYLPSY